MVRVRIRDGDIRDAVVEVTGAEGIAHLIPIDYHGLWLVNNWIEFACLGGYQ